MAPTWSPAFDRRDVEIEQDLTVFDGYFKMHRLTLRHRRFAGGEVRITRELFRRGQAVCVLLYDPDADSLVLIEQFRVGALDAPSPWLLELVAGIVEEGESAEDVAGRESLEEAGVAIHDIRPVTRFVPSPGACDEWIELLYARVDSRQADGIHGLPDEGEDIKVHVLPAAEAFALVRTGRICNGPTIIGLQWLELNRARLLDEWRAAQGDV